MTKIHEEVDRFLRQKLTERLALCTEKQQAVFFKVYPGFVSRQLLEGAISLCDRTLENHPEQTAAPRPDTQPGEVVVRGPWKAHRPTTDPNLVLLYSGDFTHDVTLRVSGDFVSVQQKMRYAEMLADRLNLKAAPSGRAG